MRPALFSWLAVLACAFAWSSGASSVPRPAPLTSEEKVLASDYVVVGTVVRIICIERDRAGRRVLEFDDPRCNDDWARSTHWIVRVQRLLCRKAGPDPHVFVRINPATELRTVRQQRQRYVGKQTIFFLARPSIRKGKDFDAEILQFAKGRRIAFPQPASTLNTLAPALEKHCPG